MTNNIDGFIDRVILSGVTCSHTSDPEPCYTIPRVFGRPSVGVCGRRATKAGYNGKISPEALRRAPARSSSMSKTYSKKK